ncbi:MAG: OmpA family protein [Kofleriaceae bacterium]
MLRWSIVLFVACSGPSTHTDMAATKTIDAGVVTEARPDAAPRGRVIITESDPCGFILDIVYFPFRSPTTAAHQKAVLDATADMLVCFEKIGTRNFYEIQGHADSLEPNALDLSDVRAAYVRDELVKRGVPPIALRVQGYGATQPQDKRNTEEGRAKNRRVQFLVLGPRP